MLTRLTLSLLLLTALPGAAEIMVADSLEWLTASHPVILRVSSEGVEALRGTAQNLKAPGQGSFLVFIAPERPPRWLALDALPEKGPLAVYTADFRLLVSANAVLREVRSLLRKPQTQQSRRVEVPFNTPAYQALWSGSSCYLVVPVWPQTR